MVEPGTGLPEPVAGIADPDVGIGSPVVGSVGSPVVGSVGSPGGGGVGSPVVGSVGSAVVGSVGSPVAGSVGSSGVGIGSCLAVAATRESLAPLSSCVNRAVASVAVNGLAVDVSTDCEVLVRFFTQWPRLLRVYPRLHFFLAVGAAGREASRAALAPSTDTARARARQRGRQTERKGILLDPRTSMPPPSAQVNEMDCCAGIGCLR